MKNFKLILVLLFLLFITDTVYAKEFSVKLVTENEVNINSVFDVDVYVENANNLWGFTSTLKYDDTKIKLVSSLGYNGFNVTIGKNIVLDNSKGINGNQKVATLRFKSTDSFKNGETTTIEFNNIEGSTDSNLIKSDNTSITIKSVFKSDNNYLKSLKIDQGTINFEKDTMKYEIIVDNNIMAISISGEADSVDSEIIGLGVKELNESSNYFDITVISNSGEKRTYTIEVIRKNKNGEAVKKSNDNTLSSIKIDNYNIAFDKDVFEYNVLLNNKDILNITAIASDSNATVVINNLDNYVYGNNRIDIIVTSENGIEQIYTINAINLFKTFDYKLLIISIEGIIIIILLIGLIKKHK